MIEEVLKVGACALVGAAVIDMLDNDEQIRKDIDEFVEEVKRLPTEIMTANEETLADELGGEPDKIEKAVENFQRACNPITRFVDQKLAMDIRTAKTVLKKGDHIYCVRTFFSHHGIYDGNGGVYHYANEDNMDNGWLNDGKTSVTHCSLESFVNTTVDGERKINVRYYKIKLSPDEIIERAKSRLGERKYNALFNNCEHFAYWCRGYDDFKN